MNDTISKDILETLIHSNLACHLNQMLTIDLIKKLTIQTLDSINYLINTKTEKS